MKMALIFLRKYVLSAQSNSVVKKISLLSMLGISVSVAAMIIIVSVMSGFGDAIEKRILSFEPDLVLESNDFQNLQNYYNELSKRLSKKDNTQDSQKLSVGTAYFFSEEQVVVRTVDGQYSGAMARGLERDSLYRFLKSAKKNNQSQVIKYGVAKKSEESFIEDTEVIIGSDLAYQLGIFIGDTLTITPPETLLLPEGEIPQTYKAVVYDTVRTGVQVFDSSAILFLKKGDLGLFSGARSLKNKVEVFLEQKNKMNEFLIDAQKMKISATTWRDRNSDLFYSLKMEKGIIVFFLILSLLIGAFSIVSVLVLLATQKKQDMGILLTLGLSSKRTQSLFGYIGFFLSTLSVIVGLFVGLAVCWFLKSTDWVQLPDVYYDRSLPVHFVPGFYLSLVLFSLLISYLSSFLPAKWILKFSPLDIFRK